MSPVALNLVAPGPALAELVSHIFEFRADLPRFDDVERADIAQIRFMLTGHGHGRFADGTEQQTTRVFILGPTTGPLEITLHGPVLVMGISMTPAGWAAFVGVDASLLTNRIVDAAEIYGREVLAACDAMAAAPDFAARTQILSGFLLARIARDDGSTMRFVRDVTRWLESDFSPDVVMLVDATGRSRRQVERLCKRLYGVTPKLLARKHRALRASLAIARGTAAPEDCIAYGFYDQSHMIREIKQFTGTTPGAFDELSVMSRLTLEGADHIDRMRAPR